jgi:zinc protease
MMKRMIRTLLPAALTAVALLCSVPGGADAGKRPHPSKLAYPPLKVTTPKSAEITLPNGLNGFVIEDHEVPVVDIVLLVRTYYPDQAKFGLNEMAQWVIRNGGSQEWPADRLNDELEFLASYVEVYGGNLSTSISVNCLKRDLPRVIEIFADLVQRPAFPEDKIEMKRKTMIEDIRRKNDEPNNVCRREYSHIIYKGHPYSWESTEESVGAITRADLVAFHEKYFHPNNAILGVSGDITKDEITAALSQAFAGWGQEAVEIPAVPDLPETFGPSVNYAYMDLNQAYVMMGHQGINANNPDRCAIDIMNYILGGGSFTSWITEKVRSDEGLAYSAGSGFSATPFAKGLFTASAQTKAEACGRVITILEEQIRRMRDTGPNAEEVSKAVDSYVNGQVFDYESKSQVVRRLVSLRFEGRPLDTPERDMATYARLTVDDVKRVAQKYLAPDKLTIMVVGNAALFDRPLSDQGPVNEIKLVKTGAATPATPE